MILPTDEERIEIINCLRELDCCSRCILRLLGVKDNAVTGDPEVYLKTIYQEDVKPNVSSNPLPKIMRRNPCRVCLDIFQDATIERFMEDMSLANIKYYNYSDFLTHVSFPKSILIRNHSIFVYLKEKFPHIYTDVSGIESLNKIFRISSSLIASKKLKKYFDVNSNLVVLFEIGYTADTEEVKNIANLYHLSKVNKKGLSKNIIIEVLSKCDDKLFKEQFPVPPEIPNTETFASVSLKAEQIWIGGRYLKFSRDMGQTPWIINDKVMAKYCLQDILFDAIEKVLGCKKENLTFCASGREDADVRMLGDGRPFYVAIDDPRARSVTFEQFRAIEMEVFQLKLAAVIKLQHVIRTDLKRIKYGEEHKRKHYLALCHTTGVVDEVIKIINSYGTPLLIDQKTPLRVLHRRTHDTRKKYIYEMHAKIVPGHSNLFEITILTQAGTYVKEFVNGDFHRTSPSLCSIIQKPVDIVALDVTGIELTWPEDETMEN